MKNTRLIWLIEEDSSLQERYARTFGFYYRLRHIFKISDLIDILRAHAENPDHDNIENPSLIISEVKFTDGLLIEAKAFKDFFDPYLKKTIITSSSDDKDMIRFCLKNDIIDYLVKPINIAELAVKVEKHMSNINNQSPDKEDFIINDFTSDLTMKEIKILYLFFQNKDYKTSRKEINQTVWKEANVQRKTIDVHIFNLRKKMKNKGYNIEYSDNYWILKKIEAKELNE